MFRMPTKIDRSIYEGTVVEIDIIGKVCKVKTVNGQNLPNVRWLKEYGGSARSGDRGTPQLGDCVIVNTGLGYPLILGCVDRLDTDENKFPLKIDSGQVLIDTGRFSDSGNNAYYDPSAPKDMVVGDRVISSTGGGLLAILRGGSVLLRSSRMAEVFLSKWDDLVRIVSRNWEHFTDVSSDIVKNINGRVYRYTGYAENQNSAKVEAYHYHRYYGDVALAEAVKTNYQNPGALPVATDVIFKEQVTTGSGGGSTEVYKRELHLNGIQDIVITNGTTFTRIKSTNGEVTVTYNDVNVIKVNATEISLKKGGDPISAVLTDTSVKTQFNGAVHTLDSNGVSSTFAGHFVNITSSGISLG